MKSLSVNSFYTEYTAYDHSVWTLRMRVYNHHSILRSSGQDRHLQLFPKVSYTDDLPTKICTALSFLDS